MVETIEVAILAGGLSTRMGRDKARLRLGGRTLLAHVKTAARQAGLPVRIIRHDLVPRCGPLGGVYTALKTTSAEAVLFLSCDMPFVSEPLLAALRSKFGRRTHSVFCMTNDGAGFPFLVQARALRAVEDQIRTQRFSLQLLAASLKAVKFRPTRAMAGALFNVNTPAEWTAARARWRAVQRSGPPPPARGGQIRIQATRRVAVPA